LQAPAPPLPAQPALFAGLSTRRPLIMGVLNVTPDSFSDGGDWFAPEAAAARGRALAAAGADIVDVGGESTRPGAVEVDEAEECRRILPVVAALAADGIPVSVDTRHRGVLRAALDAGARIANDVSALTAGPASLRLVRETGASAVLVHMQGAPDTMQLAPRYTDVVEEVLAFLAGRVAACRAAGIGPERLAVDPGYGFGKTLAHNLALLRGLARFAALGCTVALGVSRKASLGRLSGERDPKRRLPESLAAGLFALDRGVRLLRVHDVEETRQALAVWQALRHG